MAALKLEAGGDTAAAISLLSEPGTGTTVGAYDNVWMAVVLHATLSMGGPDTA